MIKTSSHQSKRSVIVSSFFSPESLSVCFKYSQFCFQIDNSVEWNEIVHLRYNTVQFVNMDALNLYVVLHRAIFCPTFEIF